MAAMFGQVLFNGYQQMVKHSYQVVLLRSFNKISFDMQRRHIRETQGNHLCSVDNGYMTCKQETLDNDII